MAKQTFAELEKELELERIKNKRILSDYNSLVKESEGLKRSFDMIKVNYEREKTRLDKSIDSLLNISKR